MTKADIINKILDANIEYPMVILSEADWKGGRQCDSVFGERAQSLIEDGPDDFDYIEFVAESNNDLYRAVMSGKTFTDEYDTDHGIEEEVRSIECFIPWN